MPLGQVIEAMTYAKKALQENKIEYEIIAEYFLKDISSSDAYYRGTQNTPKGYQWTVLATYTC